VLRVGEMPLAEPVAGEVRVRLRLSGVNPGDIKKRQGWLGSAMAYPRIVPHSDGAGVIDAVGPGVDTARVGQRVWVYGAQSYRPFGTAAEATAVPQHKAVEMPDAMPDELGAALGIPGITAHRAVFGDGPVAGRAVLVHGVRGAVGSLAAQLARLGGANVIGTVRRAGGSEHDQSDVVVLDDVDAVDQILRRAPGGVDRIVEVAFASNVDLNAVVAASDAVIAAYGSPVERPDLPFWPLLFKNVTLRLLGSDDFDEHARRQATDELTRAAAAGELTVPIAAVHPLDGIVAAHEAVEAGTGGGRVLVAVG
jgi:NADPH2:quinone reductase